MEDPTTAMPDSLRIAKMCLYIIVLRFLHSRMASSLINLPSKHAPLAAEESDYGLNYLFSDKQMAVTSSGITVASLCDHEDLAFEISSKPLTQIYHRESTPVIDYKKDVALANVTSSSSTLPTNTSSLTNDAFDYGLGYLFLDEYADRPTFDDNTGWVGDFSNSGWVDDFYNGAGNSLDGSQDDVLSRTQQVKAATGNVPSSQIWRLPPSRSRFVMRLLLNHVQMPTCFSDIELLDGHVSSHPEYARLERELFGCNENILLEDDLTLPILREPSTLLQVLLESSGGNLSENFRKNVKKFNH